MYVQNQTFTKTEDEVLDYTFDFTSWMPRGDSISSSSILVLPSGELITSLTNTSTKCIVNVSGGVDGKEYTLNVRIITTNGLSKESSFVLAIRNTDFTQTYIPPENAPIIAGDVIVTPSGNLTSNTVQLALEELQLEIDSIQSGGDLANHINNPSGAHAASSISVSAISNLTAIDVQSALAEHQVDIDARALTTYVDSSDSTLQGNIDSVSTIITNHISDTVDAHDASAISNIASGNLAATNVQDSLVELQSDIDTRSSISYVDSQDATLQSNIDSVNTSLSNHITDTVDAHDASAISNIASGNLAATNVQDALNELQTDIDTRQQKLLTIETKITSYNMVLGDEYKYFRMDVASANDFTIPDNTTHAIPVGSQVTVKQHGAGQTTIVASGGVTINTSSSLLLRTQHSSCTIIKVGLNEWDLFGDMQ